ncbi:uncharacterized protein G2W53_001826 [Senna tora]|uniref:Uncharacterized protein n=1 Tax=Senna tora TaxID=362788 RepID=A0A835CKM9_9FABA|nr:uncharacterized protein G2W53_001826 [Senna tora]
MQNVGILFGKAQSVDIDLCNAVIWAFVKVTRYKRKWSFSAYCSYQWMELLSIEDPSPTVDVATVVFDGGHSAYLFDGGWIDGGGASASMLLSVLCFASMV